ncbi:His Kinase A (phospho-acceptor) domain-containing protein [Andreprevotia lacus DSM 23236]|jgi:signal transduction histidine kinase|uniref:histidine kinase n=1 Tax=Andreprevotia lacus DSM 23236 TaxID=1121001 RepID=A0A1W1X6S0_9NEIS|nr:ATP-binding protein [Andreprevotia lacus]SMC19659.1 His Kinase A (phospho-acceptor) domain-containing protein [Andreprevotia lacus DSM 23236]
MTTHKHTGHLLWMIPLFACVTLVVLWGMLLIWLGNEKALALRSQQHISANLLRAIDEHMTSVVREVDQTSLFIKERYESKPALLEINDLLDRGVIINPYYTQIGIVDAAGILRMTSKKPFKPVDLHDREHFIVHAQNPRAGLFISTPVLGRSSGRWSIQFTRRLNDAKGDFLGIVVVSVSPDYFTSLYRDLIQSGHDGIMLVGRDGIIRAQQTARKDWQPSGDVSKQPWFNSLRMVQTESGSTQETEPDGDVVRYSVRPIEGTDLLVVMRTAEVDALTEYEKRRGNYLTAAGVLSLLFVIAGTFLTVQTYRLQQSRAKAESANRLKSDFLARVSHELRTPLNSVLGAAELLHDTALDKTTQDLSGMVLDGGRKLDRQVTRILQVTQLEAGMLGQQPRWFQPETVLREVVSEHQSLADAKLLDLDLELHASELPVIHHDPQLLKEICSSLVHNALTYTSQGKVRLIAEATGSQLHIAVSDTGPGIAAADRERIFEPFGQIDAFLTRAHKGSGLSLSVAQQLVKLAGGQMALDSTPGSGSTFRISLPIKGA